MAGQGRATQDSSTTPCDPVVRTWPVAARWLASILLVYHVAAMFVSPWVVPPTSVLAARLQPWFAHYQTLLYLNHGYRFFAPNPGPASVVIYELEFADGSRREALFPDRSAINRDYPRLMYHRWFMLSESLGRFLSDHVTEEEFQQYQDDLRKQAAQLKMAGRDTEAEQILADVAEQDQLWIEARTLRRELLTPLAQRLLKDHDAVSVRLFLNQRIIPMPDDVERGWKTDDPRFLPESTRFLMGTWRRDDPGQESREQPSTSDEATESLPAPLGCLPGDQEGEGGTWV